jgi:hypothetical protein
MPASPLKVAMANDNGRAFTRNAGRRDAQEWNVRQVSLAGRLTEIKQGGATASDPTSRMESRGVNK